MKTAFIYSDKFEQFSYSPAHPLKPVRFKLTYELARAYGLFRSSLTKFVKAAPCAVDDLVMVHSIDYIEAVEHADRGVPEWERDYYGLGTRDNPLTPHVFDWSLRDSWNWRLIWQADNITRRAIERRDFAFSMTRRWRFNILWIKVCAWRMWISTRIMATGCRRFFTARIRS